MSAITAVQGTERFIGSATEPRQVIRVQFDAPATAPVLVRITGAGVAGFAELRAGVDCVEVGVSVDAGHRPGDAVDVTVHAGRRAAPAPARVTIAEPGWTMYLVSHFHYDPVWWNTQAAYTSDWPLLASDGGTRPVWQHNGFDLVRAHLQLAADDADYRFVLAEVDYLKPFLDVHPECRQVLRELVAAGRVEIMGGTYNEPNTNLTGLETTIRNLVYGVGYQRDIMHTDPQTAWLLDVFGHDPQFPGLAADAGLTSSSWARGPFHQWGPILTRFDQAGGDVGNMQFPAEFEWLAPSGRGVLTHYMPNHYSAGWWMDSAVSLAEAEEKVYELYLTLKQVAATRNLLLPVGTDYTPPNKWVTEIHRNWNCRYVWPRFVCGLPRDFFAAVRADLKASGRAPAPLTRDMNPVYTGKDVSYIDTKQAHRAVETAATDAEKLATFASLLGAGRFPHAALDKVWRQLCFAAHHDAITGTESDQVYIDLVGGWREAHDLAAGIRDSALAAIASLIDTGTDADEIPIVVTNTLACTRTDVVQVTLDLPREWGSLRVVDDLGNDTPVVVVASTGVQSTIAFVATDVPSMGWRVWRAVAAAEPAAGWSPHSGHVIANDAFRISADPARGGALSSIRDLRTQRELLRPGCLANELRVYDEYPAHPQFGEGPWHLSPSGPLRSAADENAESVRVEHSPAGQRLIVTGSVGEVRYEQRIILWYGLDRVDLRTRVLDFTGTDRLLRVKFALDVPGARPVCEVAGAVIGRGFGIPDVDSADAPWTLDNPANTFCALSNTARLRLQTLDGTSHGSLAISIAEVVVPDLHLGVGVARDLVVALGRVGVTATTSSATGPRYGWLHVDSNLPDLRVVIGDPEHNALTREILDDVGSAWQDAFARQLDERGAARLLVPGRTSVEDAWLPNADLRSARALPALIIAGASREQLTAEIAAVADEFARDAAAETVVVDTGPITTLSAHTVAVLNRGVPGFTIDRHGGLQLSLLRSSSGWPSGVWIDPPVRRSPDGSAFQLQHWTHEFDYALVSAAGDWRAADLVLRGHEFNTPLHATVTTPHPGTVPARHGLLEVQPERRVTVTAVKPSGNPHASGRAVTPLDRVSIRMVDATGRGSRVSLRTPFGIDRAHRSDLLEQRAIADLDAQHSLEVAGADVATVSAAVAQRHAAQPGAALGPDRERAQPIYARYWLHNCGAAPMGFLPVTVALGDVVREAKPGQSVQTTVVVASQRVDAPVEAMLEVITPPGWHTEPARRPISLQPSGYTRFPLELAVPTDAAPGVHFVRVQLPVGADVIEDVLTVIVPGDTGDQAVTLPPSGASVGWDTQSRGTAATTARPVGVELSVVTTGLQLSAGSTGYIAVDAHNHAHSAIDAQAMLVSPWGTWDMLGPSFAAVHLPAHESTRLTFTAAVPIDAEPGHWWAIVKLTWFGRVQYGPAVSIRVSRS